MQSYLTLTINADGCTFSDPDWTCAAAGTQVAIECYYSDTDVSVAYVLTYDTESDCLSGAGTIISVNDDVECHTQQATLHCSHN